MDKATYDRGLKIRNSGVPAGADALRNALEVFAGLDQKKWPGSPIKC